MSDSSVVEDRPKSKRVGALRGLVPFLWPYRGMAALALMALILWKCIGTYQMQVMMGDKSQQLGIPISLYWLPLLVGVAASILALIPILARLVLNLPQTRAAAH